METKSSKLSSYFPPGANAGLAPRGREGSAPQPLLRAKGAVAGSWLPLPRSQCRALGFGSSRRGPGRWMEPAFPCRARPEAVPGASLGEETTGSQIPACGPFLSYPQTAGPGPLPNLPRSLAQEDLPPTSRDLEAVESPRPKPWPQWGHLGGEGSVWLRVPHRSQLSRLLLSAKATEARETHADTCSVGSEAQKKVF